MSRALSAAADGVGSGQFDKLDDVDKDETRVDDCDEPEKSEHTNGKIPHHIEEALCG